MNSFKKLAVVMAAALSFGTLSAIPTNATVLGQTLTIDAATDVVTAGESATAVVTLSFIAQSTSDTASVFSVVTSQPTGANKTATLTVVETTTAVVAIAGSNTSADVNSTSNSPASVSAKLKLTLDAPSVAGTYVFSVFPTAGSSGGIPVTWTVTVNAPDLKAVAGNTTSILNAGETTSATSDATVYAAKTVSTDAAAVIVVNQKNAAGATAAESMTVTISGSGLVGVGTNATTLSATGRALVLPAGSYVGVFADGTSGVGTVTITTVSGVVLATEKVTFYGDIAKVVATTEKSVIAAGSNANAVSAIAYDANGVVVGAGTLYATSSTLGVISNSYTAASIVNGVALWSLTGVTTGSSIITVGTGSSATSVAPINASPVAVRVEGSAATVKIAFDKAVYVPGEAATITVTVVDKDGLPVSSKTHTNLFATGGIVSSYAFGSGSDAINAVSVTTDTATVKTYKVFMPITETTVTVSATGGTSLPTAGQVAVTAEAKVVDANAAASKAATKEALDAANAATDAATKAAEAADKSTEAAKAASDAVAKLSADVATLIASLKKQITSLTALVIKIQKKVNA